MKQLIAVVLATAMLAASASTMLPAPAQADHCKSGQKHCVKNLLKCCPG